MPIQHVNSVELYYELHGDGETTVALNNGIIANTASWSYQLAALTEAGYRVLLYDMRGQGRSQKWQPGDAAYTWEQHADDLAALLDALGIARAHVGGISYGGELTLVFALRHPARCGKLIVADAVSQVDPLLRAIADSWARVAALGDPELFYRCTWYWNFGERFFNERYDFLLSRIDAAQALDLPSVIQLCRCFVTLDITGQLGAIRQPACVIVGANDILKPVHYAETIAAGLPQSALHVLPEVGHASFWEAPEAFNAVLLDFLAE